MIITAKKQVADIIQDSKPQMGYTTGIPNLDRAMLGFRPGHLIVIAGFSGIGKSGIMVDMGLAAASQVPVVMLTLEMGCHMTAERILYNVADLNYHRGIAGDLTPSDKEDLKDAAKKIDAMDYDIILDDTADCMYPSWLLKDEPENSIELSIKRYVDQGCRVFFIDYLQYVNYGFKTESESLRIKQLTGRLHKLCVKHDITVVALAQLKKEVGDRLRKKEDPTPTLSDIRDSGFIINDADIILLLHRPEYFQKQDSIDLFENRIEPAQIVIGKQRNGPRGPIDCLFHSYSMKWVGVEGGI